MHRTTTVLAAAALLTAALTACGSSSGSSNNAPAEATTAGHVAQSANAGPTKDAATAWAIIHAAVPTSRYSMTVTAENDDNHLLGRPHEYTSAIKFTDTRVNRGDVMGAKKGDVDWGGGVEVFTNHADTQARATYIQAVTSKLPMFTEYDYVYDDCLVRVSHYLTPTQAADYKTAGAKLG